LRSIPGVECPWGGEAGIERSEAGARRLGVPHPGQIPSGELFPQDPSQEQSFDQDEEERGGVEEA
jgi:hypothetical protein